MALGLISVTATGAPSCSSSMRSASVNALTAAFEAAYMPCSGNRAIGEHAADVDEHAAAGAEVFDRDARAIDDAPEVGFE